MNALKSLKFRLEISIGKIASGLQALNKLKPINIPPLASKDVFRKFLLLKLSDLFWDIVNFYSELIYEFFAANLTAFSILL